MSEAEVKLTVIVAKNLLDIMKKAAEEHSISVDLIVNHILREAGEDAILKIAMEVARDG